MKRWEVWLIWWYLFESVLNNFADWGISLGVIERAKSPVSAWGLDTIWFVGAAVAFTVYTLHIGRR